MESSSSALGHRSNGGVKYIYDLPFFDRKEICRIFDENNQWETLGGGLMAYSNSDLSDFGRSVYRGASPTDALLTAWGNQNHTVLELFTLCAKLYNSRAMSVLAKYVDPKYHVHIRDPDFQATQELEAVIEATTKDNGVDKALQDVQTKPKTPEKKNAKDSLKDVKAEGVGLPQIPYTELSEATQGWHRSNMLGRGGFGTVYKGVWKSTPVAIKRMEQSSRHHQHDMESQMKQSLGELRFLNTYRHDNILPIYGYSLEGPQPCLVYQFMSNGSLEDRILCRQKTPPLTWQQRYHIAKGVACGIQFLHSIGPQPLIHGDIKSANILLDRNFESKVGDFGLAREMLSGASGTASGSNGHASYVKVSRVHGTRPYLPDEYLRSKKLSTKVDTFSFGIVLFELSTGQRAYEEQRHKKFLKDLVEEFDGILDKLKDIKAGQDNIEVFWTFLKVGRDCTERMARNRPEMVEVLKSLETAGVGTQRTLSTHTTHTHVTGLPYLFNDNTQRPGSLAIPSYAATNYNRNSPEMMRAASPHWVFSGLPSPGQSGYPSPFPPSSVSGGRNKGVGMGPQPTNVATSTTTSNTNTNHVTSNSNNISSTTTPMMTPLTVDTFTNKPPEVVLIHPSPQPLYDSSAGGPAAANFHHQSPLMICERIEEGNSSDFLPLVLEDRRPSNNNTTDVDEDLLGEVPTVIPLITELGIKD